VGGEPDAMVLVLHSVDLGTVNAELCGLRDAGRRIDGLFRARDAARLGKRGRRRDGSIPFHRK
jgi:hypothetical protein